MSASQAAVLRYSPFHLHRGSEANIAYCDELVQYRGAEQFREYPGCPVIFLDILQELPHAAYILSYKGTAALREHLRHVVKWPAPGSPEGIELSDRVSESVQYWRDELESGFDPAEMDDDSTPHDEADRLIVGWLTSGTTPEFRDMCFELAWPWALRAITEAAEMYFPDAIENKGEQEELGSFKIKRWLKAADPFKSGDWLPRAALFQAYTAWCAVDSGSGPGKPNDFYVALKELGCIEAGRHGTRGFRPPRGKAAQ